MDALSKRIANLSPEKRRLLLERLTQKDARAGFAPIPRQDRGTRHFPLSFAQQRIWFLQRFEPESAAYHLHFASKLSGPLDTSALKRSLEAIVRRHEVLRTVFPEVEGRPVQVISPAAAVEIPLLDVRYLDDAERSARLRELADQGPFDLACGPLFRTWLIRTADQEHLLLLSMHHLVSDGVSMQILFRELLAHYEAFSRGGAADLPELRVQYADYAAWERERLQGEFLASQLEYWKDQLRDDPPPLELPTDRPRPPLQTFTGDTRRLRLTPRLSDRLRQLSRREQTTLFMTLLAAFKTLLARWSGQADVMVGTPIANRHHSEVENLIGLFLNTLVLRTDLSGDPTFRELLGRVRDVALGAYAHQDLPFEKLVETLHVARDLSRPPLFQVMFNLLPAAQNTEVKIGRLTAAPFQSADDQAQVDLTCYAADRGDHIVQSVVYNTDLFDGATIERMLGSYETLLEGIAANPDQRISELPILTATERRRLVVEWNRTQRDDVEDVCLHQLVEAQAAQAPDAVAVVFEDKHLTYAELNARANQLARHLQSLEVGTEDLVAIYVDRSHEMVVALLAVLKAGAAYLPLDPMYPRKRIAGMLDDAASRVIITEQHLLGQLPEHKSRIVCLDRDRRHIADQSTQDPGACAAPDQLAYVIYTSGSTGKPKGVQIPHRAVVNFLASMADEPGLTSQDTLLAITTLSFDISVLEVFLPLGVGARVEIVGRETAMDAARLKARLASSEATVMQATPTTWRMLLDEGWQGKPGLKILCGGEPMPRDLADRLVSRSAGVWNLYGPTETTIWSGVHRVAAEPGPVPIGRPIANTQFYVTDGQGNLVPQGVPGELCIGGAGLARGYRNRPERTREKFVPDPFSDRPDARLYRTGDLVRCRGDGRLEFLGRLDHQVKIRGFRIELGEIEAVLARHPATRKAVVVAREDRPGDKRLAAYVVSDDQSAEVAGELRESARRELPDYMVPSAFVFLDELPLTPNKKIDRKALPAPGQQRDQPQTTYQAPRDALELQLANTWEKVLGTKPIGVADNFFDLGGHSLLAVSLFAQIEKATGRRLPLSLLFEAPTVRRLADRLRDDGWSPAWSSIVPVQPGGSRPPFFCVHPGGGYSLYYRDLANRLGNDQPFFALEPPGLDGRAQRLDRVEEIAAHYLREIRTVQPEGPYYVGGLCFGGIVAYEMAQQLNTQGETVGLVALLDTYSPQYVEKLNSNAAVRILWDSLVGRLNLELGSLWLLPARRKLPHLWKKLGRLVFYTRKYSVKLWQGLRIVVPLLLTRSSVRDLQKIQEDSQRAYQNYRPRAYPDKLTLLRATRQPGGRRYDPTLGWGELAQGGLDIQEVPGHHASIALEPRVGVLAEKLRACLEQNQATARQ